MCSGAIKTIVKMEKGVGDQELRTIIHILLVLYELFLLGF